MKNNLNEIIKERLENRLEWKNYLGLLLTHRELHKCAKRKFYENKPFLNLVLKVYFLPLQLQEFSSQAFHKPRLFYSRADAELHRDDQIDENIPHLHSKAFCGLPLIQIPDWMEGQSV